MFHLLEQWQQLRTHHLQLTAQQQRQTPGHVHVHAAVEAGGFQRHIREGLFLPHQIAVDGRLKAEFPFRHQVQPMLGRCIAQIVRQQGVDHHSSKGDSVAKQDQPVVFGVLQCFGVIAAGQPGRQGIQHHLQGQLDGVAVIPGFVSERDVGEIAQALSPADSNAHQFGFERVEIGGFRVHSHRRCLVSAVHQSLKQGVQGGVVLNQLRLQLRKRLFGVLSGGRCFSCCRCIAGCRCGRLNRFCFNVRCIAPC
ncbi:MAG: Uncharacterised protein [Synechococcus sp. CC9902]|nr:MAG: Uncharacterised protein [Synechococcus sp. CC9902]